MRNVKNLTLFVLMLALVSNATGGTLHVPGDYGTIQAAIDVAVSGDEIEVAPGTYNEAINFNGKAIRLYSSDGPEVTTINGAGNYHVVQCVTGESNDTILEGFTITGGNANGTEGSSRRGGGMYNNGSSPTVINCTFTNNSAIGDGGAMYFYSWCTPIVTDCTFNGNQAGGGGAGMVISWYCNATISGCTFSGNTVTGGQFCNGGGLSVSFDIGTTVTNCTFNGNSAGYKGGGMYLGNHISGAPPTKVINCTFIGNSAPAGGGGMYNMQSGPEITNCTYTDNTTSGEGGAVLTYYGGEINKLIPNITNCILWGDTPDEIVDAVSAGEPPTTIVNYSDVQGGWTGTGNIDADPMFADAEGRLSPGSPCIDVGDNSVVTVTTDLDGNTRIQGTCVDMGAFETTADPVKMLAGLALFIMDEVDAGNIDAEMEGSLLAKVDAAIAALDRDNPNDAKVAMNDLKALVNQVEAQTDKKITPEVAAEIIQRANAIIAVLGG